MRALQLEDYGRMAVVEMPDPTPGAGEIALDIVATGICGSDIHGFTGENGRRSHGQVMGHESVGRIHALGAGVDASRYPLGAPATFNPVVIAPERRAQFAGREQHDPDRSVIGVDSARTSAFAQRMLVPAENVVLLPTTMPLAFGALIEPLAVALNAVRRVGLTPGETVFVSGGGPIGQSVILAALREGASRVYVSEFSPERRDLCASLGAHPLDPRAGAIADQVLALEGGPVDVAIDAVGISETLADCLSCTPYGGRVCLVGMGRPELTLSAFRVSTEERSIVGSFCYSFPVFEDAAAWAGQADPVLAKLISLEVPLDDGHAAFERLATRADVPGKILVRLDL